MKQPFMTALFTVSSHDPFVVPEKYKNIYKEEHLPIQKCIRYTDMAIGKFFESASKQPWFKNTIFVLTSDHTNQSDHEQYKTDIGGFCSPIIIYDPSGEIKPGRVDGVAQQIDIMPTLLFHIGYDAGPYLAFGKDLLHTPAKDTWAVNYLNGIYQYVKYGYVLQWDGKQTKAIYRVTDALMKHNLLGHVPEQAKMERELKAIIYQYMYRMVHDKMYPTINTLKINEKSPQQDPLHHRLRLLVSGSPAAFSCAVSTLRWPLSSNITSGEVSPQGDMEEP